MIGHPPKSPLSPTPPLSRPAEKFFEKNKHPLPPVLARGVKTPPPPPPPRAHRPPPHDHARHGNFFPIAARLDLAQRNCLQFLQPRSVFRKGVARNVEAQHRVFAGEPLLFAPRLRLAQFDGDRSGSGGNAKEPVLAGVAVPRGTLDASKRGVHGREYTLPRTERIHSAGLDEALEYSFVQETRIDAFAKIKQRPERAF